MIISSQTAITSDVTDDQAAGTDVQLKKTKTEFSTGNLSVSPTLPYGVTMQS